MVYKTNSVSSLKTVLYLSRYYIPATTGGGIRAGRFVDGLVKEGLRVIVVTVGEEPRLEEKSPNLLVCRISAKGELPGQVSSLPGGVKWPMRLFFPGPNPDSVCNRGLFDAGGKLIEKYKPDLLYAMGTPI